MALDQFGRRPGFAAWSVGSELAKHCAVDGRCLQKCWMQALSSVASIVRSLESYSGDLTYYTIKFFSTAPQYFDLVLSHKFRINLHLDVMPGDF